MLRTCVVQKAVFRKKIGFDESFDVTKCLQQIDIPDLLHMCAPCSKLPSIIRTMFQLFFLSPVFFIVLVSRGFASGFCLFYSKTKIDHGSSFCFPQARALFLGAFLKYWLTLSSASKVILGILEERVYHNLYYLFFSALRYLVLYSQWLFFPGGVDK